MGRPPTAARGPSAKPGPFARQVGRGPRNAILSGPTPGGRVRAMPAAGPSAVQRVGGRWRAAVVVVRPSLQTFLDPDGREGVNAVVRIDVPASGRSDYLWIDEIARVRPVRSSERPFTD